MRYCSIGNGSDVYAYGGPRGFGIHVARTGEDLRPLGLVHDGATFRPSTLTALEEQLRLLQIQGYRVPAFALALIEQEKAETIRSAA